MKLISSLMVFNFDSQNYVAIIIVEL